MMVGRPVQLTVDKGDGRAGRARARGRRASRPRRRRSGAGRRRVASPCARGEILALAGVQGNGQTELTEALLGLRPARRRDDHASTGADIDARRRRTQILAAGVGYVPEDRLHDGLVGSFTDRGEPGARPATTGSRSRRGAALDLDGRQDERGRRGSRSSTSAPRRWRRRRRRCPAATSRRWWSPASCPGRCSCWSPPSRPAASTSARSSSCTSGSSPSATAAPPWCWSPPSSTRCSALADRIAVMYRGRSSARCRPAPPADEIGLLMAGSAAGRDTTSGEAWRRSSSVRRTAPAAGAPGHRAAGEAAEDPVAAARTRRHRRWSRCWRSCAAMVVGAVLIAFADQDTRGRRRRTSSPTRGTPSPRLATRDRRRLPGAVRGRDLRPGTPPRAARCPAYLGPISETLTSAAPLILAGLSVGLAFRAGLFNIGAQGQIIMGAIFAGYVGFALAPAAGPPPGRCAGRRASSAARSGAASPACSRRAPAPTR